LSGVATCDPSGVEVKSRERYLAIYMGLQRSAYCYLLCRLDLCQWGRLVGGATLLISIFLLAQLGWVGGALAFASVLIKVKTVIF
jgi:hypothetical protein